MTPPLPLSPPESTWRTGLGNLLPATLRGQRFSTDAALAIAVLAMIALMILPVRPWLLDLFLCLNLAVGAVLLMASVLTPSGTRIFTFPTILILTTLLRLALDVSSTRLILSEGNAGDVIRSFGQFAAGGSVVVGLVVFLIITLVQLIVISKGAERTANATAVFVRESIPGRQLAIDADAAAGRISPEEVAQARLKMAVEVEFYGRMYGAMEFIKGDSVASLVVAAINITGGLVVGIVVNGLPPGEALETYTLLTIGAGLVSQIPALIGSVAGTILVSRVAAHGSEIGLGETAVNQFRALPKALVLASVMLAGLGLVPGMPALPFLLLSAGLGWSGYRLTAAAGQRGDDRVANDAAIAFTPPALVELRLHSSLPDAARSRARANVFRLIEKWGNAAGIPFSLPHTTSTTEAHAPPYEFLRRGATVGQASSWEEMEGIITEELRRNTGAYFGLEEAARWLAAADVTGKESVEIFEHALGQINKNQRLHSFLKLLVEERFPIRDSWGIISRVISAPDLTNVLATADKRHQAVEEVRLELMPAAARHFITSYASSSSRLLKIEDGTAASTDLIALGTPKDTEAAERLSNTIIRHLPPEKQIGPSVILCPAGHRAALGRLVERLFQRQSLFNPVFVLSHEEAKGGILDAIPPDRRISL